MNICAIKPHGLIKELKFCSDIVKINKQLIQMNIKKAKLLAKVCVCVCVDLFFYIFFMGICVSVLSVCAFYMLFTALG